MATAIILQMHDATDMELLRDYARQNSEAAFAELVRRHVNLVYSAALRHVGIAAQAEETAQAVFIILARKAGHLREGLILEAWLYETTRLTALSFLRGERRRQFREQEAYMQSTVHESTSDPAWQEFSPLLDEAMMRLGRHEREAVVLRFFKDRSMGEVAAALNIKQPAAQMRIGRALDKLRKYFLKRGVSSTNAIIAGSVSANSVQAAPAGLATTISAAALAKGAAASASTLTLVKGALKLMAWTKAKTAIAAGVGILLASSFAATVTIKKIAQHRDEELWARITRMVNNGNLSQVETLSPTVSIRPTKFSPSSYADDGKGRMLGLATPASGLFGDAYAISRTRIANPEMLPSGRYDFIVTIPDPSEKAFQEALKGRFGLVAKREPQDMDVLVLQVANPALPGLKPPGPHPSKRGIWEKDGHTVFKDETIEQLALDLEHTLKTPVIDETGLTGRYDINLPWSGNPGLDKVKQVLLNQLGLTLTPSNQSVETLVLKKAQ